MRNSLLLYLVFCYPWPLFFSGCSQDFFIFSFLTFNFDMSWCGFLQIYPLESLSFLNLQVATLAKFGKFSTFFLECFFCCTLLPFFWDSDDTNVRGVVIVPQVFKTLFFPYLFLRSVFSLLSGLFLVFSLTVHHLVPSFCCLVFYFNDYIFQLQNPHLVVISPVSLLMLSVLIYSKHVHNFLLKHFSLAALKSLPDNSDMSISVLASIECLCSFGLQPSWFLM